MSQQQEKPKEKQQVPHFTPPTAPLPVWPMRPLVVEGDDASVWQKRSQDIRERFARTLGPFPETQKLHSYTIDDPVAHDGVRRSLVRIVVDEDDVMEAWLLEPLDAPSIRRAALAPHPTSDEGKDEVVGLAGKRKWLYALELAQRGWIVLAPDAHAVRRRFSKGIKSYDTVKFYERWPQWSSVGKIIADHRICIDLMEKLPQTRGLPVSILGHSLGGQTAIYTTVADPRIESCVCNCGIYPFADSIARDHWFRDEWYIYYKDSTLKQSVKHGPQPYWDFHEIASLIAPRRLMIFLSPNDYCCGNFGGINYMSDQLLRVWQLLGAEGNVTCVLHNEGHEFRRWHRDYAYAWLEQNETPPAD